MASMQQGEKQLFEKFWRGTFKAVATPRPGSILVASIIARRTVANSDTSNCQASKADEGKPAVTTEQTSDRNGCIKARESKHRSHHRSPSLSFDEDLSPPPAPKGKKKKKKKKKSDRKRRRRSPSYSPSPVRKKKKKSSRKRYFSYCGSLMLVTVQDSSTSKSKRKVERKHRKRSRSHSRRRHRCRHSESESSTRRSSSSDSRQRRRSPEAGSLRSPTRRHTSSGNLPISVEQGGSTWVRSDMPGCKAPLNHCSISSDTIIKHSGSAAGLFTKKESHDIVSNQHKGHQDYDSGNDTSSPPSTKTGLPRSKDDEEKNIVYQVELLSPEKLRFNDDDSGSDSGNSVSSYSSLCQPLLSASPVTSRIEREVSSPCLGAVGEKRRTSSPVGGSLYLRGRSRTHSHSSSKNCISRSSSCFSCSPEQKFSSDYSRRRSLSSEESCYSRSSSYSAKSRKRSLESWSSQSCRSPSYSRYNPDRSRETDNKKYGSKEKESKRERERRRCQSYSPMRKRRRDSPSHLEARRITSARKRPIPYYRPSPSSSSRSSSCCSWYSTWSRSATRCHSGTRSRSRSRSHSSYRNHSRSPYWSSGSRRSRSSRSESYDSLGSSSRGHH
ncbi:serine/arginine repetitive matrix protein 4-like isoform X1 [Acipenser oxyrinchus oxyrinchus]|uniref:Serine/arginine repetitive matrix protein 4-like isoform X1 n=1 Tax=Acipenser oxyrinchus oxyrinchus TaxID=40147 RepID=A0AAD8CWC1_ACIOX|nr:serine/arginine repetitive matrix protein 4-like isoform X1 [Acipenser oxyrinchus oxyrinchus]